ncbi:MAG: hypothetical protein L3J41_00500 [Melioribacteraceae bacterium]|nr:hypothetical protein [Melioribacteraceae bacterium]
MDIVWDREKNKWLKLNRGIFFEEITDIILSGNILDVLENPSRENQQYYVIEIKSYTWVVPFLIDSKDCLILKTAFPSRKFHEKYGGKMKEIKLTKDEKLIEDNISEFRPISEKKVAKINEILANARKNKSISLRISNYDLEMLKEKAERIGMPYQTLINSVLHKYVTNQLLEEDEMIKSLSSKMGVSFE